MHLALLIAFVAHPIEIIACVAALFLVPFFSELLVEIKAGKIAILGISIVVVLSAFYIFATEYAPAAAIIFTGTFVLAMASMWCLIRLLWWFERQSLLLKLRLFYIWWIITTGLSAYISFFNIYILFDSKIEELFESIFNNFDIVVIYQKIIILIIMIVFIFVPVTFCRGKWVESKRAFNVEKNKQDGPCT